MEDPHAAQSGQKEVLRLSIAAGQWQFINTIVQQLLTFGTFFVLARFLSPGDYGTITLIMLLPTFLDGVTTFSFDTAALQKNEGMGPYLNVVWTFNIIRAGVIFLLSMVLAPFVAQFFHIDDALPALYFAGTGVLLQSLINIGQNYLFLSFDFKRLFFRDMALKVSYAFVAIALAVALHTYWALFWANIISIVCVVIATYMIHPYRPRLDFNFRLINDLRHFSQWLFAAEMLLQTTRSVGDSLMGRYTSPAALGIYGKANALGQAPTSPIISAINKVSFSSYIRLQDSRAHVAEGVTKTFDILATIAVPYLIAILFAGHRVVEIALGDKWIAIVPYLKFFAVIATMNALSTTLASAVFNGIGRPKIQFTTNAVYTGVVLAGFVAFVPHWGIWGATYTMLIAVIISSSITTYYLLTEIGIDLKRIAGSAGVIALACVAPLVVALRLLSLPFFNATLGYLLLFVICGVIYAAVIVLFGILFDAGPYATMMLLFRSFGNTTFGARLLVFFSQYREPVHIDTQ